MAVTPRSARTRSRTLAAASGVAALALALGACGEEGEAEQAVGEATSAVGSVAAEATSAVGSAAAEATSAVDDGGEGGQSSEGGEGGATTGDGPRPEGSDEGGDQSPNPDEEFLNDIQRVGVDTPDEQDYITRGRDACTSLDEGTGYVDVLQMYNDAHPDAPVTEAPVVVTAAVKAFCSQHLPLVDDEGGDGGA